MSENSKIQWTDDTMNFWQGCTKISPGCQHCYAEARDQRFSGGAHWGKGAPRVRSKDFEAPIRWNQKPEVCGECGNAQKLNMRECLKCGAPFNFLHRRRVFVSSLADIWDEEVPIEWLADALDVIRQCPNLNFLLLTKRPENWRTRLTAVCMECKRQALKGVDRPIDHLWNWATDWLNGKRPPANIWIGCTVENQEFADKRIPQLSKIPAVCRFISYEPALGPVDFSEWLNRESEQGEPLSPLLDQIIVGGESGPHARPFNIEWARSTIAQCQAAGVACFFKQAGSNPIWNHDEAMPRLKDKKGGDLSELPKNLNVREFPCLTKTQ